MKFLVTGGAGFIGSSVIREILKSPENSVLVVDCLTYAGRLESLVEPAQDKRYGFEKIDIRSRDSLKAVFERFNPERVLHLAAESHVDRSIDSPARFIETNILGTMTLLEVALDYYLGHSKAEEMNFLFHHVSTDEVFGSIEEGKFFTEKTPYDPRSPYSASKACSDHLVMAWYHTYGLPVIISNCSNNYGPRQFPEKLIPLMILNALDGKPLPIYGDGSNVRDWIHVEDHARALLKLAASGRPGETYLLGGDSEYSNLEVVKTICSILDDIVKESKYVPHGQLVSFVKDRPGHDFRYAINFKKAKDELNWSPNIPFKAGLRQTINWYLANQDWWLPLVGENDARKRIGLRYGAIPQAYS